MEEDAEARALIRRNVEALGLTGVTKIFRRDATDLGSAGNRGGVTLVFLDPPYGQGLAERALASAAAGGWLAPGAIAVIEERKGSDIALPDGLRRARPAHLGRHGGAVRAILLKRNGRAPRARHAAVRKNAMIGRYPQSLDFLWGFHEFAGAPQRRAAAQGAGVSFA